MRSTWKLLSLGYLFINADYMPVHLEGGSSDIGCVTRVNRTAEFLFYCVMNNKIFPRKIVILCVGNLSVSCASLLSKRLRSVGTSVEQLRCSQPAALARITFNKHLIGTDPKYSFCSGKAMDLFSSMIRRYKQVESSTSCIS
jgi:hypothetical protein